MKAISRKEFLTELFKYCEGQVELRAIPCGHRSFFALDDFKGIDRFCQKYVAENVYFTVATRNGGGTKEHIVDIPCVWADIDFKTTKKADADKHLHDFPLRPTFLVQSGGGYHVYWMFKERYGKEDIEAVEALNRQLATSLHADLNVCDASHVLRLPDTQNVKPVYKKPRPVKCHADAGRAYDISDFEFLPEPGQEASKYIENDANINNSISLYGCRHKNADSEVSSSVAIRFDEPGRDVSLFHLAHHLVKGNMPRKDIEIYLNFFASKCSPPFTEKETERKIQSALSRKNTQEKSLASEVKAFVVSSYGAFLSSDVVNFLGLSSKCRHRDDRKQISKTLSRLVDEGVIERCGAKNGCFRRIETESETIDFLNASSNAMDIAWPFQIEQFVSLMPGNVAILAGEKSAGKTAFLFNLSRLNMDKHKVFYFSSELHAPELKVRLSKYDAPLESWQKIAMRHRTENFHDAIMPDGLNIIDFLEVHDEHYKVGGLLKKIHNRLTTGAAIVALQKPVGRDEAVGGRCTMEVARLYLSLTKYPNQIKIVDGKMWATDANPNGLAMQYKIIDGIKIRRDGEWSRLEK
ncbi:MAG: hypothetical protein JW883_04355 [Deltaproteobacteria bacterium]|nr:hypothetical protein [Deltaproteobacteria bacterium]